MSTHAYVAMKTSENECLAIYTNFDGYPDHHGPILLTHYNTREKVEALLALGDLSALAGELGQKHNFNKPNPAWCLAYGRDRGEMGVAARTVSRRELAGDGIDYGYLFDPATGEWSITLDGKRFSPLAAHPGVLKSAVPATA